MKSLLVLLSFSAAVFSFAQEPSQLSIRVAPEIGVPPTDLSSTNFYLSPGARFSIDFRPTALKILQVRGEVGYSAVLREAVPVSLLNIGAGVGTYHRIGRIGIGWIASGGIGIGFLGGSGTGISTTNNPYFGGGIEVAFQVNPSFSVGIEGYYRSYVPFPLFQSAGASITASYHFPRRTKVGSTLDVQQLRVDITDVQIEGIFPVFFKYYDDHSVGRITLHNRESTSIENVKISFFIKQYMDGPKQCAIIDELGPEQTAEADLYALLTDRVLDITEDTKAVADIILEYEQGGKIFTDSDTITVRIYDRNAITWTDDRRAAAFVTRKDPVVLSFSKAITGSVKGKGPAVINGNLIKAMALYEAIRLYGMNYEIDPSTPMSEYHQLKTAVDFLQFPKQTLEYKAGDCDDLSILYSALLESVGIETAFITTPGHIFMAFSTGLSESDTSTHFKTGTGEMIFRNNLGWIPVEVTALGDGFLGAWARGARQWRDAIRSGDAQFYPIHEAWELYEPVGMPGEISVSMPDALLLLDSFERELSILVMREVKPQEEAILKRIEQRPGNIVLKNRLGSLYGKYLLLDEAEKIFSEILDMQQFPAVLVNMGNVMRLKGDDKKALEYYQIAANVDQDNATAMLQIAKVLFDLRDFDRAAEVYLRLEQEAPEVAEEHQYLALREDGSRAAESSEELVIWVEE